MGVRFSPDGKLLAVGDGHEIGVFLWDLQAGKVVGALGDEEQQFYVDSMAFTPDGKILATPPGQGDFATPRSRWEKSVLLWDTVSGKVVRRWMPPRWILGGWRSRTTAAGWRQPTSC